MTTTQALAPRRLTVEHRPVLQDDAAAPQKAEALQRPQHPQALPCEFFHWIPPLL